MSNIKPLPTFLLATLFTLILFVLPATSQACDRSDVTLDSLTVNGGIYTVYATLCIGAGTQGVINGADGPTGTFSFSIFTPGAVPVTVSAFSPAAVTSAGTQCTMAGLLAGAGLGAQENLAYINNCPNSFACISSTATCGLPATECFQFSMSMNLLPDSIRVFGVEGAGNPFGGCYPNPDMLLVFGSNCTNDTQAPTFTCPGSWSLPLDSNCMAQVPSYQTLVNVSDNCDPNPTVSQTPTAGTTLSGLGSSVTVSLFATDASMNTSSNTCSFTATTVDTTRPNLICPGTQSLTANANCQALLGNMTTLGSISDNCDPNVSITSQVPNASANVTGNVTVSLFGSDASSNSTSCTFQVIVQDVTPPSLTCPPAATLLLDANCQAILPNFGNSAQASDNCASTVNIVQSPNVGTVVNNPGMQTVTLTADDGANNTTTCTIAVTTVDTIAPQVNCPANQVITPTTLDCNPTATWTAPSPTDNCSTTLSSTHNPGDNFPTGVTTVTYTTTDGSGNTGACSFTITVNAPQLDNMISPAMATPCDGDTLTLTAMSGFASYSWNNSSTTASIDVTATGWYWVDITDANNCTGRDSIRIDFLPLPQPVIAQSGNDLCVGTFVTYQWYENGTLVPGATGPCLTPTSNANYTVVVTDSNGCGNESAPFMFVNLEPGFASHGFSLSPNPAHQMVRLHLHQDLLEPGRILIFDLTGRVVYQHPFAELTGTLAIDLSHLAEGSYIVEVSSGVLRGTRRLIHLE